MNKYTSKCKAWYDNSYSEYGEKAQRKYPNEELCRFLSKTFSEFSFEEKNNIKVLEVGCGSCANLWMIAKEGFLTYGCDISQKALEVGESVLDKWGVSAELIQADMCNLPFPEDFFDAVIDVFSSYCLPTAQNTLFYEEVSRVLRPGGHFFSFIPSKESDCWKNPGLSKKIDSSTLERIVRKDSLYYGNDYPFRFTVMKEIEDCLEVNGMELISFEKATRTYNDCSESFVWNIVYASKK